MKIQATTRPGNVRPESWSDMSTTARKEKQERAIEMKSQRSTTLEERKAFNPSNRKMESTEKPSKREAKCGDSYGGGNAFANWKQRSAQRSCGQA